MEKRLLKLVLLPSAFFFILIITACTSIPSPDESKDSLLIVVIHNYTSQNKEGSVIINLKDEHSKTIATRRSNSDYRQLLFFKVPTGYYSVSSNYSTSHQFKVEGEKIALYPYYLVNNLDHISIESMNMSEAKIISRELPNYIEYSDWAFYDIQYQKGFNPRTSLGQESYQVEIDSDPSNANILIDGEKEGRTPFVTNIKAGKHDLELIQKGFTPIKTIINVDDFLSLNFVMDSKFLNGKDKILAEKQGQYRILVDFADNIGTEEGDAYIGVITDALAITLDGNENIQALIKDVEGVPIGALVVPDWKIAEKLACGYILQTNFSILDGELLVHAVLYDARKEVLQSSFFYSGESGLAVFDSVDDMTLEFLEGIKETLPDLGSSVVRKEENISVKMVEYKSRLSNAVISDNRTNDRNSWLAAFSLIGRLEQPMTNIGLKDMTYIGSPSGTFSLGYDRYLNKSMALGVEFKYLFSNSDIQDGKKESINTYSLSMGPRFSLTDVRAETLFGLLGQYTYGPKAETALWVWDLDPRPHAFMGPFHYLGVVADFRYNNFLNIRIDEPQNYFSFGFRTALFEWRFTENFILEEFVKFDLDFYVGFWRRF